MKHGKIAVKKLRPSGRSSTPKAPTLDKVIGSTAKGANGVAYNLVTGDMAYTASGVIVFYNAETNR
jgi:hypothetical protein